jgi:flagellar FliL protein
VANKKLLIILTVIIIAGTVLLAVKFVLPRLLYPAETAVTELSADEVLARTVQTEEVLANLQSDGFIQIQFQIQGDSTDTKKELELRMFQIRHIILHALTSQTSEELKGSQGLINLETTLQEKINDILQSGKVIKVFTTKKFLQ